jgi:hypothetical protein
MRAAVYNTVQGFIRHAEVYGTEMVFETAWQAGLTIRELGQLSLRLQHIDPTWKLRKILKTNTGDFAAMLIDRGVNIKQAAEMAQVSTKTARDHLDAAQYDEEDLELA